MTDAEVIPDGYMADAKGRLIRTALVKSEHLMEDALVRSLHAKAAEISEQLRQYREAAFADIEALLELLAERHGAKLGGDRGNLTLNTFDGTLSVQVSIGDQIDLGPELQAAKALIDDCRDRWSEGSRVELQAIVNDAFDIGKKGKIDVGRVLGLRRLNIDDPVWKRAMDAIGDAMRIVSSKRYLRLHRKGADGTKKQVPLDLASA